MSLSVRAAAAAVLVALALAPAAADAAWRGTPGKIAYLDRADSKLALKVVTPRLGEAPEETAVVQTWRAPDQAGAPPLTAGLPSAPAWSPDGTRLAYAAAIDDPGIGDGASHTAIFVWNLRTRAVARITTPPAGAVSPPDVEGGYVAADSSPAWSPDGRSVAFVRFQEAGRDDARYAQRGGEIWTVPAAGGTAQQLTSLGPAHRFMGLSWGGDPQGASALVGLDAVSDSGIRVVAVDPAGGGATTLLSGTEAAMVADFDVAPDGLRLEYMRVDRQAFSQELGSGARTALGALQSVWAMRSSPTGNGPLHLGATTIPGQPGERAGLLERRRPDASGDVWAEDPLDRWVAAFVDLSGSYAVATIGRTLWDVQAQQLPIVNIPGFAGSRIVCGAEELWPPAKTGNGARLLQMALQEDGRTNAGCAGPTADANADDGFVSTVFGLLEIYEPQEDFVEQIAPGDRGWRFSWDWRKRPGESTARLDALIDQALQTDFALDQGVRRVVLYGHSYGGLLMREYVESHPEKVARTLTVGTPYLGVPKPLFFIGFGIENPLGDLLDLDLVLPDAEARAFARNAAGAYHLIAQDKAPVWMTHGGAFQGPAEVRRWYGEEIGANVGLFDEARAWHARYDGFTTMQGTIETRAVIGTGLLSITGIEVPRDAPAEGEMDVQVSLGDGDVTVPVGSAGQGPLGTRAPLGDPVHVQAVCRVKHMDLGGSPQVTEAYADYLLTGRTPRRTPGACRPEGVRVRVVELEDPGAPSVAGAAPADRPAVAAGGALTPQEAASAGRLQLLELPQGPTMAIDDGAPLTLALAQPGRRVRVELTRYEDGAAGAPQVYDGLSGDVRLTTGDGGAPVLTVDGVPVTPAGGGGGGGGTPGGGDGGSAGAPAIASMRLSGRRLTAAGSLVLAVRTRGAAQVRLAVVKPRTCARRGGTRRCTPARTVARLRAPVRAGAARFTLKRRIGGRVLAPGAYRLVATPVAAGGRTGRTSAVALRVAGRR